MGEEPAVVDYKSDDPIRPEQIPDNTITIILKCGGKMYTRKVLMEESQELNAKLVAVLGQMMIDTVDTKGLYSGKPQEEQ